jgi:RNA polymerase sigma-70 factor, ECF subfamily
VEGKGREDVISGSSEKSKKGNTKAFQKLIEAEKEKHYRMAYLYVKNESDAIDIVHETIYKAFISIKNLKETDYFSTWLMRILINTALDFIKKNKRVIPVEKLERCGNEENLERRNIEERMDLVIAIARLEEKYKTVIILRYYNDLPIKEIAKILNCPEGTVKTNLHRAIQQLRTFLERSASNE